MLHMLEQGAECCDVSELFETMLQRVHQEMVDRAETAVPALPHIPEGQLVGELPIRGGGDSSHRYSAI